MSSSLAPVSSPSFSSVHGFTQLRVDAQEGEKVGSSLKEDIARVKPQAEGGNLSVSPADDSISATSASSNDILDSQVGFPGLSSSPCSLASSNPVSCTTRTSSEIWRSPIDPLREKSRLSPRKGTQGLPPHFSDVSCDERIERVRPIITGREGIHLGRDKTSIWLKDISCTGPRLKSRHDMSEEIDNSRSATANSSAGMEEEGVSSRPPIAQRSLSAKTSAIDPSGQKDISPSPLHSSPPILSAAQPHTSPQLGLARLPEDEIALDVTRARNIFDAPGAATDRQYKASRHRSTSSAAALQSFGSESTYLQGSSDPFGTSASIWSPSSSYQGYALRSEARAFSPATRDMAFGRNTGAGSYSFSPPFIASHDDRGQQANSFASSFGQQNNYQAGLPGMSIPERFDSESRRHSMTGGPPASGQRRAIGFELIDGSDKFATASTSGQNARHLFGAGDSAIADDDLNADFDALRLNLDQVAEEEQKPQSRQGPRNGMQRASTTNTFTMGAHAASMPPSIPGFGDDSSWREGIGHWPLSARLPDEEAAEGWARNARTPQRRLTDTTWKANALWTPRSPEQMRPSNSYGREGSRLLAPTDNHGASARTREIDGGQRMHNVNSTFESFKLPAEGSQAPVSVSSNLSEMAIASLTTLGPLAPSGGPSASDNNLSMRSSSELHDLGKGVPLQMLSRDTPLYIVEFKQGRTDLYFRQTQSGIPASTIDDIRKNDLVIVEADRGKDLGTVINDSITVEQVQTFLAHQAELAHRTAHGAGGVDAVHPAAIPLARLTRSINPKRLFSKAGPSETNLLHAKAQDEERALALCTSKIHQRGLPMSVVAAELQWDRRKLTFYYTATQRVDFRDLVKELFRLYKTRIWMCHLSHPSSSSGASGL